MNHGMFVFICLAFPCQHAQEDFDQARDFYNQGLALKMMRLKLPLFLKNLPRPLENVRGICLRLLLFFVNGLQQSC